MTIAFVQPEMDIGSIILWALTEAEIPAGWQVADGTNGTLDMTDRFIQGADVDGDVGVTGGQNTHTHVFSGDGHNHTVAPGPPNTIHISSPNGKMLAETVTGSNGVTANIPKFNTAYYIQKVA